MARQRRVAVTTRNLPRSTSDLGCDHSLPSAYRNLLEVSTLAGTASESLQGDRILAAKEFEQAIVVPSGEESFSLDAAFLGGFPAEEVEGHVADAAEVFGGMAFANAALVLGEAHIEHVVQFVLDAPVTPNGPDHPLCVGPLQAADVIAAFPARRLGRNLVDRFHHGHRSKSGPAMLFFAEPIRSRRGPDATCLDAPMRDRLRINWHSPARSTRPPEALVRPWHPSSVGSQNRKALGKA